ncbi:Uncharacterised protein [Neisseria gonorrhoeae]|nr:hypothetical protein BB041_09695 [Neisseria gonorrhoeae]CNP51870.1 Uncharacterised protein [Neisseria gonorrhoeae]CNQ25227.1 Uncharacterised protein [Neisseria gonorrhoeae]CNQ75552.1 Uncharacterised protein [Neisseria gonorrhoeae]
MFKRPEEIIVLILAVLWIAGTYFLAALFGADAYTVLKITALTLLWSAASFLLWQKKPQPAYLAAAARLPDCLLVAVSESIGRTQFFTLACIMDVQNHLSPDSRNRRLSV